jgi:hypothetical protein
MQGRKALMFVAMLVPCVLLAVVTGCKREYPTRVISLPTLTPTNTPTVALTNTFTRTWTLNPTTPTPTPTPTLTPMVIDNFDAGSNAITINSVLGTSDPNVWFAAGDNSCTPSFSIVTPFAGNPSSYCGQLSGSGCTTFGSMGFYFSQGITNMYGGTSLDIGDNSTGVRFDIVKAGGNVSSVRFEYLDDYSTNGIPGNSCGNGCGPGWGEDLVVGSTWKSVTIFWSTCTLPSWYTTPSQDPPDPSVMYGMHWIVNSNGQPFDIQLDNVTLINDPPPPTPTPNCNLIDDMETGKNRGALYVPGNCGSTSFYGHNGFWYTYHDSLGGTIWPASSEVNFMSSPGAGGSNYACRLTGTNSITGGDIYAGVGINLTDPKSFYDLTLGGLYSGIKFDAMVGTAATVVRFKIPDSDTDPDGGICPGISTCSSANASNTNGCCFDDYGMDMTLTGAWTNYRLSFSSLTQSGFGYAPGTFKPQQASALQWQFQEAGLDYDLWLDNVYLY